EVDTGSVEPVLRVPGSFVLGETRLEVGRIGREPEHLPGQGIVLARLVARARGDEESGSAEGTEESAVHEPSPVRSSAGVRPYGLAVFHSSARAGTAIAVPPWSLEYRVRCRTNFHTNPGSPALPQSNCSGPAVTFGGVRCPAQE